MGIQIMPQNQKCHSCGKRPGEYQWMTRGDKIVLVCRACWNTLHRQLHGCGPKCARLVKKEKP